MSTNLPEVKRLLREDFTDVEGEWVDRLIYPINSFNEQVYSLLDKSITIDDNIVGDIYTTTFTTSANYISSRAFSPIQIPWSYSNQPRVLILAQINEVNSDNIITNPVQVTDWKLTNPGIIQVRFMVGLHNSTKYKVSFLIL